MPVLGVSFYTVPSGKCISGSGDRREFAKLDSTSSKTRNSPAVNDLFLKAFLGTVPAFKTGTGGGILLQLTVLCVTRRVQRGLEAIHGFHVRGRGRRGRLRRRGVLPQVQGRHDACR